jgi:hypothetical protein
MLTPDVVRALAPLPPGYTELARRVTGACAADHRVRGLWLVGSIGRGAADAGSDLDVAVAVADEAADEFRRTWPTWLATWTPTVLAAEIPGLPGALYTTTPDCERLDVVIEAASAVATTPYRTRLCVLDKDGLDATIPSPEPAPGPDPARMTALVTEALRQLALFPAAVIAREDWLLGVVGVGQLQQMLYQLLVETNQPLPPMGVKQWSSRLTPIQRRLLIELPTPSPTPDGTSRAMRATWAALIGPVRSAVESQGAQWPDELDAAVRTYLSKTLGWDSAPSAAATCSAASDSSAAAAASRSTSEATREASAGE